MSQHERVVMRQSCLKVLTLLADVLLFVLQLTELLLGRAELLLDLLLPALHTPHALSQDSDHLVAFLQLLCTDGNKKTESRNSKRGSVSNQRRRPGVLTVQAGTPLLQGEHLLAVSLPGVELPVMGGRHGVQLPVSVLQLGHQQLELPPQPLHGGAARVDHGELFVLQSTQQE